ncbi:hypothetical protein SuUB7_20580 [Streptococcus uberis]
MRPGNRRTLPGETKTKSSDKMKTLNSTLTARPLTQLGNRCRKCGFITGQIGCPECEHIALQLAAPALKLSGFTGFKSARAAKAHARHVCGVAI